MTKLERDEKMMRRALELARQAALEGEVPVGAVVARGDEIIAEGRNRRESCKNALCHAEIEAIDTACRSLHGWRLWECDLYVTLEPCPMCTGAILNARIARVIFGASDPKAGSCGSIVNLFDLPYNHHPQLESGILREECGEVLTEFFQQLRDKRAVKKALEPDPPAKDGTE